jgi:DNA polymerase elongation subunit (family B)
MAVNGIHHRGKLADTGPRTLLIDIETFPRLGYYWHEHRPYNIIQQIEGTVICCVSAKWLGGKQDTFALPDFPKYRAGSRDDARLMKHLWNLLDEAEIVIAHNGDRFDIKKINARMTQLGLPPYAPFLSVDTLKEAKKIGSYDSHRLNFLAKIHGHGEKVDTGGQALWFRCMEGDEAAWRKMRRYNAQDVILLEKIYLDLRPWMKKHPNMGMYQNGDAVCPKCGSGKLQARGYQVTASRKYPRFQCVACGSWGRDTRSVEGRASLVNAAR